MENVYCADGYCAEYDEAVKTYNVGKHEYKSVVTPPTMENQGYTTHTCSRCGDSYVDSYVDSLGFAVMIDGVKYKTFADAIAYLNANVVHEITLHEDIDEAKTEVIFYAWKANGGTDNIEFDLNGHSFKVSKIIVKSNITVHIKDSSVGKTGRFILTNAMIGDARNKFIIDENVTVDATIQMNNTKTQVGSLVVGNETFIGENGIFMVNGDYTAYLQMGIACPEKNISIKVGYLVLNKDYTVGDSQKLTISASGTLEIPTGIVLTLEDGAEVVLANKNGKGTILGDGTIKVNSFKHFADMVEGTGIKNFVIGSAITADESLTIERDITVTGMANLTNANNNLVLKAGTYDMDVTEYCAEGYACKNNGNGTWTVGIALVKNVRTGTRYASLTDAVNAAKDGDTLQLLADIASEMVTVGQHAAVKITIDLNGKTLNSKDVTVTATRNGTEVTLTNGKIMGNSTRGTLRATNYGKLILGNDITVEASVRGGALNLDNGSLEVASSAQNVVVIGGDAGCLITTGETKNNVVIGSGTYTGSINFNSVSTYAITGGTYTQDVTKYCADRYGAHNNNNGTWTVKAVFIGSLLLLEGNIGLKFFCNLDEYLLENATIKFTIGERTVTFDAKDGVKDEKTVPGMTLYTYTAEVFAEQMADDVQAEVILNGSTFAKMKHSVRNYAMSILKNPAIYGDELVALVKEMLNYGAYAQVHFGYNTDDLANNVGELMTDTEKQAIANVSNTHLEQYKVVPTTVAGLGKFVGAHLVLKSETSMIVYFHLEAGVDVNTLTFTVDGKEVTPVQNGNYCLINIPDIPAQYLDKGYAVKVTNGTVEGTFTVFALSYCYSVLSQGTDATYTEDLKNVVKALYLYNEAADSYFGQK